MRLFLLIREVFLYVLVLGLWPWPHGFAHAQNANIQANSTTGRPRLVVQLGHSSDVTSIALSPDGRYVVTGSYDKTARLWELETGKEIRRFRGHRDEIHTVAYSPDGRYLLTGSGALYKEIGKGDNTARLWEVETGKEVRRFEGHLDRVSSVKFSPDGRYVVTGSYDKTARLWEVTTGKELRRLTGEGIFQITSVAFSPDGLYAVVAGLGLGPSVQFWETATGRPVRSFMIYSDKRRPMPTVSLAFSPDGKYLLIGNWDAARILEVETGKEIRRFQGHSDLLTSVTYSPDGRYVLTGSKDKTVRLWEADTNREIRRFGERSSNIASIAFSLDGRYVMAGGDDNRVRLWETSTGKEAHCLEGVLNSVNSVIFSRDGRFMLIGNGGLKVGPSRRARASFQSRFTLIGNGGLKAASLWAAETGKEAQRFEGHTGGVLSVALSPDGRYVLTGSQDGSVRLWEIATGKEAHRLEVFFSGNSDPNTAIPQMPKNESNAAQSDQYLKKVLNTINKLVLWLPTSFSPDGRYFLAGVGAEARMWETDSGKEVRRFPANKEARRFPVLEDPVISVCFSPDGRYVLTASSDNSVRLYEADTGKEARLITADSDFVGDVTFSPDGRYILTGHHYNKVTEHYGKALRLWETDTGKEVRRFEGNTSFVDSVAFSPDGQYVLAGTENGIARMWETDTGKLAHTFAGHLDKITSVTFSPDGRFVLTAGQDGTARLWNASSGKELSQQISFRDGTWAVVDPEGRFDSNNLEEIRGLHWIMPDDPLRPLPLEIFMRDYYEPRLLTRILNGEQFKPVRSLTDLNRAQPPVRITSIKRQEDAPDLVTVTVEVSKAHSQSQHDARGNPLQTGVFDLRLFRNDQIVGQVPQASIATSGAKTLDNSEELLAWRRASQVKLDRTGKQIIRFKNIRLPRSARLNQVEFSSYAFNEDRVISQTDRKLFDLPEDLTQVKGRAYVITVGVNAYQNTDWNLRFAADDAKITQRVLSQKLRQAGEYVEVVSITLLSDYGSDGRLTEKAATKANFKAVLDALAGRKANAQLLRSIANADKLSKATPEDLVVISIASHGDADKQGDFYLFPYDIGEGRGQAVTQALLSRCISSDELSVWLRDVDAGEMVLIVDACHSAASVEGQGFKPGPMGSRGLGQLAYDKGMRILAASQADDVAIESEQVRAGLLTYALIRDGIEGLLADRRPRDQKILLDEWLRYGAERVPGLYEEVRRGEVKQAGRGQRAKIVLVKQGKSLKRAAQQPQLFDFAKKRRDIMLVKF